MTGPEHFRRAEELLDAAFDSSHLAEKSYMVSLAHVHSTLALAAATLDAGERPVVRGIQWAAVFKGEGIPAIPA